LDQSVYRALATNLFVLKFPLSRMFLARCNILFHERKTGYPLFTVPTRDELKALIDQLPELRLEIVRSMLEHHVHPPQPRPEIEQMQQRSQEYKERVEQRFRETRKPGTIGGMAGGGSIGMHHGTPFGRQGFSYWDEKALVHQTLQSFDGQELEIMERLSLSPDRTKLSCVLELSSGGRIVNFTEEFPIAKKEAQS
jgi:DNA-binding transcriptional MerR regulator